MQKRANRILSMLLVLVMVLSMLPATVLADSKTESALKGWNIILGDDIGVKFTLNSADYTVITTVNGAEVTPTISGETVTVNVAAAQMTDIIGLTVKNGEETVHTGEYSVRKYADTILNGSYDAEVKDMVKQMLNYGAAAQVFFNHNNEEGKLANDGITVDEVAVPTEIPTITITDNLAGISLYGVSLVFQNKVAVRFYFNVTGDINSFSFSQGTPVEKGGRYYVEVAGINPQNLADEVALSVNDGALSVSYSPLNYITRMYNKADSSAELKALVQAMYGYHLEAVAYQKYLEIVKIDTLVEHPDSNNNWTSGGIYMATQEPNDAPYKSDWTLEYAPTSSSVIKRIRNGETIDVAIAGRGTIVKYDADQYYLNVNSWTMGENAPAMDGDIYIIEGDFYNAANDATIRFAKNYIYLNGTNAEFSKEMPTLPTVIEGGMLQKVDGYGWTGGTGALIFKMANTAPNGGYAPTDASNIKLIRNGETYDVAYVGQNVINKSNDNWYTVEFWTIVNYKPLLANDILVIEGEFKQASSKTTLNISKTYVLLNADGSASFSAEMPSLTTVIDAGMMSAHANGWKSSADAAGNLQFAMAANDAPTGYYRPTSAANVKLIRNGVTYDVGHNLRDTIAKENNAQYIFEFWTIADHKPMVANDILVVEGEFRQESSNTIMNITKTYILLKADGTATFSAEMPSLATVIDAGVMSKHSNGWNADALYFSMAENEAPAADAIRYKPEYASNIKLIRDGATYDVGHNQRETIVKASATGYYIALWTLGDYKPLKANDILIVEGNFTNAANNTTLNISKTYILIKGDGTAEFSTEMPSLATIIDAGVMSKHSNGWNADALYFSMAENEAPAADAIRYKPEYAANVKLIRDGATYDVGHNQRETIVKASETGYYIALWTLGDYKPLKANDILIVEGNFTNAANNTTLNISKTYILIKGDGTAVFSTEMPDLGTYVEGGLLIGNDKGWNGDGIYCSMNENEAPFNTDWSLRYKPASSAVIKLLRDGTTTNIANKDAETLVKYSETNYVIATWMFGSYGLKAGDILIVEGEFLYAAENVTLNVQKSYILLNADGSVTVSATEPVPTTEVDCGVMSEHADGSASEIYFSMAANSIPVDEELLYPYAGTVQLVNGTAVSSVNVNIYKLDADMYYLELDGAELTDGSYLIVEGAFENADNGYIMNIQKTYVLAEDDALVYSESAPVLATEYALTGLTNHPNGWNADGIYITHDAHNATYNSDWSVEYKPVSADVIKLVRDGQTYNIGQPVSGTLVVYDPAKMLFKTAAWTIQGGVLPFVDGDKIIIEGKFKHEASGDILVAEKTVICVSGSDLIFNPIEAGNLGNHTNGMNGNGEGIYATMAPNAAPVDGWTVEFSPMTADSYYVIRDGEQINIGIPNRGTLVKYGDTNYYLKMNSWCTNNFAYTTEDIFVIEGFWKQNTQGSAIMKIEKTYLYYNGSAWVFSATEPVPEVPGSMMQPYSENKWSSTDASNPGNLWFGLDGNDAATGAYRPTDAANVKLIRNGETYVVGHTARDTINKINDSWYVLEFWTIADYKPMLANDILIVEGDFYQASTDTTLRIEKTYVLLNADGTASYFDSEPSIGPETNHGVMNVTNWQKPASNPDGSANDGGLYFTLAENDVIFTTDWATLYKPVSADVIKLIRDGVETNVANTGAGMIIKYSATEYYLQFWPITKKPMQAGDIMIVEGMFKNESNGCVLNIAKTYILFNENGTVSVYENSPMGIDAGTMGAYAAQNWFDTNYNALYFVLSSNIAPANTDWSVRYTPKNAANIKLVRNGNTVNIANTGAETIVKIEDGLYALALDNWWWNSYAPIQDGDILIIEGGFTNAATGYTLNIDKTYINFVSKANDEVIFSTVNDTEFGEVVLPNSGDTLNIGMWNGSYHVFEDKQLKQLQDAGITKIMGIDTQWIGTTDVEGWLDRVYSYGIQVIIDLRSWDGETVPSYVNHPALIGFLMYDEPCATDFENLHALKTKFDAVMPADTLFYVNLYGSSAAGTSLMGALDWAMGRRDYDEYYVQRFLDRVGVEVLSWDSYALLEGSGIRTGYFYNFEVMASKNMPTWYTMLSSGHKTTATYYTTPTAEELRWQMAVAMTYGISNIDHYTYVSHEEDYSCMVEYGTWEPTDLYYDIKDVDNEYLAWDNIYMAYDWIGVGTYDAGSTNAMFSNLKKALNWKNYGVSDIQASEDLLVGVFEYNGENAYMITNAGTPGSATVGDGKEYITNDTTVTLTLDAADYKCVAVIDNGEISYVAVNNNTVTLNVEAYEGVFVIPVLN